MRMSPYLSVPSTLIIRRIGTTLVAFLVFGALAAIFLFSRVHAATTYTWNQTGTASWATSTNWTPTRTTPAVDDILVFDNGATTTVTAVPIQTIGQLSVSGTTIVNLQAAAAATILTIAGGTGTDLSVASGSQLNVNVATNTLAITVATGATGSISGAMTYTLAAHTLIAADASGITFNSGATFTQGTGTTGNAFGSGTSNSVVFASGSTFIQLAGSNPFQKAQPASVVVFQTGSLFSLQGNITPSFSGRTYANFEQNTASTVTVTGGAAVLIDNLTVTLGTLNFNMTANPGHAIKGNISVAGTLNFSPASAGTVSFSGTSAQTISGAGTLTSSALSTLNVANATGVTLGRDVTLGGPLSISGLLDQGASFSLTASAGITIASGGQLRNLGTGDLTLGSNVTNNGTVSLNGGGASCGDADSILIRSSAGGTARTWSGTGVFDFTDVDVQDQTGGIPLIAVSSTNSGNNTNWTFQSACGPTAAKLASFAALHFDDGSVSLEWQSGLEVNNLGYNIYREDGGKRTRVNPEMIAGSALLAGPAITLKAGRSYAWSDRLSSDKQEVHYWLEEVDLSGTSTWHGPFPTAKAQPGIQPPSPSEGRAMLLTDVGSNTASQTAPVARAAKPVLSAHAAHPFEIARKPALKLSINREGWYRVSAADLIAAGLDPSTDPRRLQLVVDGKEQQIMVRGEEDGQLDPSDSIEFYGLGVDSAVTDTRVYWLVAGSEAGRRIERVKGKGAKAAPSSFPYAVERRDRTVYFTALRNGDKENFFGAVVASKPVEQSITVQHLEASDSGAVSLEIALQGVSQLTHLVGVELNGVRVGDVRFEMLDAGFGKFSLSTAALKEGQNTVRLTALGGGDVSLVDYIRVTYPHSYSTENNALRFSLENRRQATIDGFSTDQLRVMDITDADAVREAPANVSGSDGHYALTVSAPKGGGARLLWAFADDTVKQPLAITANQPSSLTERASADLVIITHRDFRESIKPLQAARESQGLKVTVIDVEDIYDEFSYGQKSPNAIRDFLAFTRTGWDSAPRFVLLAGDASLDPKNHLGRGDFDFVPTKLIDTQLMETASDDWLADFDGDGLEDMALGRLPVRTPAEASLIVNKIIGYDAPATDSVLLISDESDGIDFEGERAGLRQMIPENVRVEEIDRGRMGTAAARGQLLDRLSRGPRIVNYSGHGNVDQWRANLLTSADAASLSNEKLSIYFALTCLNGYFMDPALDSLAESLIKARRGAVAVWASSGMCAADSQAAVNQELFRLIFAADVGGGPLTLGEGAAKARASVSDIDVRRTYILFGDPTTRLR